MSWLQDKRVLVTGASQGIGWAICHRLLREGAKVMLVSRSNLKLADAQSRLKQAFPLGQVGIVPADVRNRDEAELAVRTTVNLFGGLDGLVNNAGISFAGYFEDTPEQIFEDVIKTNYLGSVFFSKAALPHLKKGSFISFTSSVAGYLGVFGFSAYAASKFALMGFAETLRQELRKRQISISVLCPPDTLTPGFEQEEKNKPHETRYLSKQARIVGPDFVANRFVNGLLLRRFLINVNFESSMYFRLNSWSPALVRRYVDWMVVRSQRRNFENVIDK